MNEEIIKINGIEYIKKSALKELKPSTTLKGKPFVIVRTYSAGVHAGYLKQHTPNSKEVHLIQSRRIWKWAGANTLSELAKYGVSKPNECKFGTQVDLILTEAIEIISSTKQAQDSILGVKEWIQ